MNGWVLLWKAVFGLGTIAFAAMALWVTVQGARDIKAMLATIRQTHETSEGNEQEPR